MDSEQRLERRQPDKKQTWQFLKVWTLQTIIPRTGFEADALTKTAESAKNGDCLLCPKERLLRRVDFSGQSPFFAPSTGAACFPTHRCGERNGNTPACRVEAYLDARLQGDGNNGYASTRVLR